MLLERIFPFVTFRSGLSELLDFLFNAACFTILLNITAKIVKCVSPLLETNGRGKYSGNWETNNDSGKISNMLLYIFMVLLERSFIIDENELTNDENELF